MRIFTILLCTVLLGGSAWAQTYAPGELIVKFKEGSAPDATLAKGQPTFGYPALDALGRRAALRAVTRTGNPRRGDTYRLRFDPTADVEALMQAYAQTGLFAYVEPNYIGHGGGQQGTAQTIPNDPLFSRQYALVNDGTFSVADANATADADIDMELAWDYTQGSSDVVVAVLDAGMRMNHPEIAGRLWTNAAEQENGTDSDNNNYVDDVRGWDFANNDNDPTDDHGHGTNVAGIIVANGNNGTGYAGVDWNCRLMVGKILDENNSGFYSWWIDGIYYAVDQGADVINMSVGGSGYSQALEEAVDYAYNNSVTVVACMMNFNDDTPYYPAAFSNAIAVGATNPDDTRAAPFFWSTTSGSNYGEHIDLVAPGNYMYGLAYNSNTNYNTYWGGTSQATPLVTGVCALMLAQNPNATPDDLRATLRNTADDQVGNPLEDAPGFDVYFGHGRLNANAALQQVTSVPAPTPPHAAALYPNPTTGSVMVQLPPDARTVRFYSLIGTVVLERTATGEALRADLSALPRGLYVVRVHDAADRVISTEKLVLR